MIQPTRKEQDPTGQSGNTKRAKAAIAARMRGARPEVLKVLDSIPVQAITANASYVYELDATRYQLVVDEIQRIIDRWLDISRITGKPARWFFDTYTGRAYQQGTVLASSNIAAQVPEQAALLDAQAILNSQPYQRRIALVFARSFNNMRGFAGQAAEDLARVLANGVAEGASPRRIAASIGQVFDDVEGYRALRISRTEINKAYTEARNDMAGDARQRLGLDVRVLHVSALVDATRASHAARHAHIYTPADQKKWWDTGTNRINCLCSALEIVFVDGEPLNKKLIERYKIRGDQYFAQQGSGSAG